jgi:XRE family transcriptional regulator, regulator of sulfur utilization
MVLLRDYWSILYRVVTLMRTSSPDMAAKRSGPPGPAISPVLRQTFARNLRDARLSAGLSQQALADLTGLSREYVGDVEKGANASLDVVTILAKHVGRSPLDLLTPANRSCKS